MPPFSSPSTSSPHSTTVPTALYPIAYSFPPLFSIILNSVPGEMAEYNVLINIWEGLIEGISSSMIFTFLLLATIDFNGWPPSFTFTQTTFRCCFLQTHHHLNEDIGRTHDQFLPFDQG